MDTGIDAVVFDLGGVLIRVDHDQAMQWLVAKGCKTAELADFVARSGMREHETGKLASDLFLQRIQALLTAPVGLPELRDWWTGFFAPDRDMLEFARSLGSAYRVFILSNTGPLHWEQAVRQFGLGEIAVDSLTSFEAGAAKPDARIYALAQQRFGLQPKRTVFIDDLRANVRAAGEAGWHAVNHHAHGETVDALARLGVRDDVSR